MKEMMRGERSIREMMKNPIQAMDYLSMRDALLPKLVQKERMSKTMRPIDADMLTEKVTKWLNPDQTQIEWWILTI